MLSGYANEFQMWHLPAWVGVEGWLWRLSDCHQSVWWIDSYHGGASHHWFLLVHLITVTFTLGRRKEKRKDAREIQRKREHLSVSLLTYPAHSQVFSSLCHSLLPSHPFYPLIHFTHIITRWIVSISPLSLLYCLVRYCIIKNICVIFFRIY